MVKNVLQIFKTSDSDPQSANNIDSKGDDDDDDPEGDDEDSEEIDVGGSIEAEITELSDRAANTAVAAMRNDPENEGLQLGLATSAESVVFHPGLRKRGQSNRKSGGTSKRGRK